MSSTADTERLARLMRVTRDQELSPSTRDAVKALLLAELGCAEPSPQPVAVAKTMAPPRAGAKATKVAEPQAPFAVSNPDQLELKLRQLAQAEAPWVEMAPLAFALLLKRPTSEVAARMAELAFLHGTPEETVSAFARFREMVGDRFHRHMHPAVRAHLAVRLWREGHASELVNLLFADKDEDYLVPIERLCLFRTLSANQDTATAYMYARRYAKPLIDAASEFGGHVGLTLPLFLLHAGRLALNLGHDAEAREWLEQIPDDAVERGEALRLLLEATVERNRAGHSTYVDLLVSEVSGNERLKLFATFFAATRGLGGFRDHNRPALNEILRNPLELLPEDPEVWATMSELIVANRDLDQLLPNHFELFRQNALQFHQPLLDASLWQGPMAANAQTARDRYWRGVALLHHYVNCGASAESSLWHAKTLIEEGRRGLRDPAPFAWRDLHKAAYAWVSRNHYLMEVDRVRMLEQLRIAVDDAQVATIDIEEYLQHAVNPPLAVLNELAELAAAKAAPALEARVILKRAQATHLTNVDLSRLWTIANTRTDTDLAWRVATVLHARKALAANVRHSWDISGEKRTSYSLQVPEKAILERCLKDFPARAARLAYALAHVGPLLPELLAILDPGSSVARSVSPPADSVEAKVEKALAQLSWLPATRRRYRFSQDAAIGATDLPAFMQVLPSNAWSVLVARLSERMGLNAFGFRLSRLHTQVEELTPRLASRQDLRRSSGKVAQWLRALNPEQRNAWHDLGSLARRMDDDEALLALGALVCRLAVIMMPNHYMALTSLQAMRAPADLFWSLEQFIVGDTYSQIRDQLGIKNRVMVPNALQRLVEIHASVS